MLYNNIVLYEDLLKGETHFGVILESSRQNTTQHNSGVGYDIRAQLSHRIDP